MKILAKPTTLLNVDKAGPVFTTVTGEGWRQFAPGSNQYVFETYYDLAGMSMEEKTLFFDAALVQDLANPSHINGAAGDGLQIVDIMTTTPLTDAMLSGFVVYGNTPRSAFPSFDQTVYARNQGFVVDLDFAASGYFNLLFSNQMGSLSPTATDRVYVYKYVLLGSAAAATSFTIFPSRFLLQAKAKEEPEFQYLMRLMRSYNLQNEPDVD